MTREAKLRALIAKTQDRLKAYSCALELELEKQAEKLEREAFNVALDETARLSELDDEQRIRIHSKQASIAKLDQYNNQPWRQREIAQANELKQARDEIRAERARKNDPQTLPEIQAWLAQNQPTAWDRQATKKLRHSIERRLVARFPDHASQELHERAAK